MNWNERHLRQHNLLTDRRMALNRKKEENVGELEEMNSFDNFASGFCRCWHIRPRKFRRRKKKLRIIFYGKHVPTRDEKYAFLLSFKLTANNFWCLLNAWCLFGIISFQTAYNNFFFPFMILANTRLSHPSTYIHS